MTSTREYIIVPIASFRYHVFGCLVLTPPDRMSLAKGLNQLLEGVVPPLPPYLFAKPWIHHCNGRRRPRHQKTSEVYSYTILL